MKRFLLYTLAGFIGSLVALFFFVLFWSAVFLGGSAEPHVENDSVLTLDLSGPLPERAPVDLVGTLLGETTLTLRDVTEALEKAAADDRIAAVWLQPEGVAASWATLSEVRRALIDYKESGKLLIAASGANGFNEASYYLATAADSIYTPPEASFEFNGFHLSAAFFAGTLDKLGIRPQVIRAGDYKSAAETFTERGFSPENREQYRALLEHTDSTFHHGVAEARGLSTATLRSIVERGGLYDAAEAAEAGLLDGLIYDRDVADLFRPLTDQDPDEALRTISVERYAGVSATTAGVERGDGSDRIAVVYAVGTILPGESVPDTGSGAFLGSDSFAETMQQATRDETVRAVVVRVDSPGGSATASDVMWHAVNEARAHVPVIVSMGPVAASGGYYLAAPADTIVADPNTITGSIGVISLLFDAEAFFSDQLGITFDDVQTGPAADIYAFGQPLEPDERAILERSTERIYDTFVRRVADGRGLSPDSVRALGGGRVYTGERARAVGLVDVLGSLDDAVAIAAERAGLDPDGYRIRTLPEAEGLFELLGGGLPPAVATALQHRLRSPAEGVLHRQAALLREAANLHATPQARLLTDVQIR